MKAYASRTGTGRNLAALRAAGWGLMVTATGAHRDEGFTDLSRGNIALDNGAWTAHQSGKPFSEKLFLSVMEKFADSAAFAVIPDIVAGGLNSLRFSLSWLERLRDAPCLLLLPVQNGMTPADVSPIVGHGLGIFVGGDTEWKERTLPAWGDVARKQGCYLHVGRVNSKRRIRLCSLARVDSIDGTSATRFALSLPRLNRQVLTQRGQTLLPYMKEPINA